MIVRIARRELIEWARDERLRWLAGLCLLLMMSLALMGWQSAQSEIRLRETAVAGDLENFRNRPVSTVLLTEIRRRPDLRARATLLAEQAERRAATQDSRAGDPRVG